MSAAKPVLRQGSRGPAVRELQILLNAHLPGPIKLATDGDFGRKTKDAVEAFQRKMKLNEDGVAGADTWRALLVHGQLEALYKYPPGPQEPLADIAVPYIGATEAKGNRIGNDVRLREIFEADRYSRKGATDGYPWCCAFVSMCVQKLIDKSILYGHVKKPYTPSVSNFRTRWAPSQNCLIFNPRDKTYFPHKGDIVVYKFSHIGIVESVNANGSLNTIEGNTDQAGSREGTTLRRKVRQVEIVRCLIRLPVPRTYDFEKQVCVADSATRRSFSTEDFLGLISIHKWFSMSSSAGRSAYTRPSSVTEHSGFVGWGRGRKPVPTGL